MYGKNKGCYCLEIVNKMTKFKYHHKEMKTSQLLYVLSSCIKIKIPIVKAQKYQ